GTARQRTSTRSKPDRGRISTKNEPKQKNRMSDLFQNNIEENAPLADRMRPRTLDEFIGQTHIVGEGKLLRRAILTDRLQSSIFFGPPGTGKTTLAAIVANATGGAFVKLNAVTAGVKEL